MAQWSELCDMGVGEFLLGRTSPLSFASPAPCITVVHARRLDRLSHANIWKLWTHLDMHHVGNYTALSLYFFSGHQRSYK